MHNNSNLNRFNSILKEAIFRVLHISFMDGNVGYNQIFMAGEDIAKTAFRCPGAIGLFEWVVMTFGLKNAGQLIKEQ